MVGLNMFKQELQSRLDERDELEHIVNELKDRLKEHHKTAETLELGNTKVHKVCQQMNSKNIVSGLRLKEIFNH